MPNRSIGLSHSVTHHQYRDISQQGHRHLRQRCRTIPPFPLLISLVAMYHGRHRKKNLEQAPPHRGAGKSPRTMPRWFKSSRLYAQLAIHPDRTATSARSVKGMLFSCDYLRSEADFLSAAHLGVSTQLTNLERISASPSSR
jgi:hypothetical protein